MKGEIKQGLFFGFLVLSLVLLTSFALSATSCSDSPKSYSGTVYYNGNQLIHDYEIRAMMNGKDVGIGTVTSGYYSIQIYPKCLTGEIDFYVNGVKANETANFAAGMNLDSVQMNLDLSSMPPVEKTCGNGVVDPGEECDGNNFGGTKCTGNGYLFCNSDCTIDSTNCVAVSAVPVSSTSSENTSSESNETTASESNETGNSNTSTNSQTNGGGITGGITGALTGNYTIYYIIGGVILLVIIIAIARSGRKNKEKTADGSSFEIRQ